MKNKFPMSFLYTRGVAIVWPEVAGFSRGISLLMMQDKAVYSRSIIGPTFLNHPMMGALLNQVALFCVAYITSMNFHEFTTRTYIRWFMNSTQLDKIKLKSPCEINDRSTWTDLDGGWNSEAINHPCVHPSLA